MSSGWVIVGTFGQLALAVFLFMLVIFAGSGFANDRTLGTFNLGILNASIFALPWLCVVSAGIVIYLFLNGGSATAYWWYAAPVVGAAVYSVYVFYLI